MMRTVLLSVNSDHLEFHKLLGWWFTSFYLSNPVLPGSIGRITATGKVTVSAVMESAPPPGDQHAAGQLQPWRAHPPLGLCVRARAPDRDLRRQASWRLAC